ncbi:MAG: YceI family protein [Spirosomataceae bacterium]
METAVATKWAIDAAHSQIQFKVKHLVITTVTGNFKDFNGSVEADDNFENFSASFEAKVASIETGNEMRDNHLKSEDFFAAEQFPTLTFVSTSVVKKDEENYIVNGDLTIRGITKPISLKAVYGGTMTDPWGQVKAGFELSGSVSRKEFGLLWNVVTEAGGAVVSDEVKLAVDVQLVKQA